MRSFVVQHLVASQTILVHANGVLTQNTQIIIQGQMVLIILGFHNPLRLGLYWFHNPLRNQDYIYVY